MCTWDSEASPWNLLHFVGVGLIAFSSYHRLFIGAQDLISEWIVLVFVGLPFIFIQLKLGGLLGSSLYGLFRTSFPFFRGVAVMMVVFNLIIGMYFPILPVHYICAGIASVSGEREVMQTCSNVWNTAKCVNPRLLAYNTPTLDRSNVSYIDHGVFQSGADPILEYIQNRFYESAPMTVDGIGGFVGDVPVFPLVLALTWLFIFLMVGFGPRIFGWIVSILGVLSTLMMIGVLVNGLVQFPGANVGLLYYYLPNFGRMASVGHWATSFSQVSWISLVFVGYLPTMGKFVGGGKITRNITWLFLIFQLGILRHLPVLAIAPYTYAAAESLGRSTGEFMSRSIRVENVQDFVYSGASPAASFFFFVAIYIHQTCQNALSVVMILDNLMEMFDWLLSRRERYRLVYWLVSSAVLCTVLMLCGIPFTTQGGRPLLIFFDLSIVRLETVMRYFLTLGIIVVYVWQKTAKAERILIGIWAIIMAAVCVMLAMFGGSIDLFYESSGIVFRNLEEEETLLKRSYVLAAVPVVFVFIWMFIHAVESCCQRSRSRGVTIEHPPPYDDAAFLNQPDKTEGIELVSSF